MVKAAALEPEPESSLRDALESAVEEHNDAPAVEVAAGEPSAVETPAKPAAEGAVEDEGTPPAGTEATAETDEVPTLIKDKPADVAPASWKGDAKKVWGELPEAARQEVVRRERQVNQALQESAQARAIVDDMKQSIQPYMQRFQEVGTTPAQMFNQLMQTEVALAHGSQSQKADLIANLIQQYGIDVQQLDSALSARMNDRRPPQQQSDDIEQRVQQLLAQRLAPIEQRLQAEQHAQQEEIAMTIEQMSNDPAYPYFQDVREDMADLIELKAARGVYISLQQAYNTITGNTPQAAAQAQRTSLKQANATAQKAKSAAVSVGGSPSSVSGGADPGNLRASIESALDGARL